MSATAHRLDTWIRLSAAIKGPPPIQAAECCDRAGADRLAQRIVAYWRNRGMAAPAIRLSLARYLAGGTPRTRVDLRSDMLNGWPND